MFQHEVAALSIGVLLTYAIARIVYNLYFHPLSKYPGPKLLAASRIPWTIAVIRGNPVYLTRVLHDQYGPIVRVAPNELTYTDERAWADIFTSTPAAKYGMRRDPSVTDPMGGDMINPNTIYSNKDLCWSL